MRDYLQSRVALVCYCGVAAVAGWMLRDDRPIEVAKQLNDARALVSQAVEHQNAALLAHSAKRIDNEGLADALEADALPLLRKAVGLTEQAAAAGAKGETFDTFAAYARVRLEVAESLGEALRSNDQAKLVAAKGLEKEADQLGRSLGLMAKRAEELNRPAVIHLGR